LPPAIPNKISDYVSLVEWTHLCAVLGRGHFLLRFSLLFLMLALVAKGVCRAEEPDEDQDQMAGRSEIASISFEGNETLPASELRPLLATRETPGFFNKFLYNSISEKLGRKNEYYNPVTFAGDIERLRKYYENRGFLDVRIDTQLAFTNDESIVEIIILINEGYRSIIDTLTYRGIADQPASIWADVLSAPRIARGDPYHSVLLEEEVKRVLRIFNTGYPNAVFLRDSSAATRYASSRNFSVVLSFSAGKRYLFGPITIEQEQDTLRDTPRRDDITDDVILRHLDYKPGDFYSLENRISSERNLNRLGVFDLQRINVVIPPNEDTSVFVPSFIAIRPRDKHELAPELIVSNENDAFNLGTGIGYNTAISSVGHAFSVPPFGSERKPCGSFRNTSPPIPTRSPIST
jgi:outer membrane protein assembly factor BamA